MREIVLAMPAQQRHREQTPDVEHIVVRGDTLSEIAKRYGYNVSELRAVNGIGSKNIIRIGQKLRLPVDSAEWLASVRFAKIEQATAASTITSSQLVKKPDVAKADAVAVNN